MILTSSSDMLEVSGAGRSPFAIISISGGSDRGEAAEAEEGDATPIYF
jgi:hypothetical protein